MLYTVTAWHCHQLHLPLLCLPGNPASPGVCALPGPICKAFWSVQWQEQLSQCKNAVQLRFRYAIRAACVTERKSAPDDSRRVPMRWNTTRLVSVQQPMGSCQSGHGNCQWAHRMHWQAGNSSTGSNPTDWVVCRRSWPISWDLSHCDLTQHQIWQLEDR